MSHKKTKLKVQDDACSAHSAHCFLTMWLAFLSSENLFSGSDLSKICGVFSFPKSPDATLAALAKTLLLKQKLSLTKAEILCSYHAKFPGR